MKSILEYLTEQDYRGEHEAPTSKDGESSAPLYNVSPLYPEDIYTDPKAVLYYGETGNIRDLNDNFNLQIVRSCRNKPDKPVKIYRAIPKEPSKDDLIDKYIKEQKYILKFGKLPPTADKQMDRSDYYEYAESKLKELRSLPDGESSPKMKINPGDWVTLNRNYAKEHGQSNLNSKYKIISKVVTAKDIWTDGNSLNEWGYDPQK